MKRGGWDSEEQTIDSIDSETFDFTSLSAFESIVFNRRRNSKDNNAGAVGRGIVGLSKSMTMLRNRHKERHRVGSRLPELSMVLQSLEE